MVNPKIRMAIWEKSHMCQLGNSQKPLCALSVENKTFTDSIPNWSNLILQTEHEEKKREYPETPLNNPATQNPSLGEIIHTPLHNSLNRIPLFT